MNPQRDGTFKKYRAQGAYHWRELNPLNFRHYNPRLLARYQVIVQLVQQRIELKHAIGLDVGCGDGALYDRFVQRGAKMIGVDYEITGLYEAQRLLKHPHLLRASAYELPFLSNEFDFVVMSEVIEHLETPRLAFMEFVRILRPRGILVLTTPHRKPSGNLHSSHHIQEFRGHELKDLLGSYFQKVSVWGMYPSYLFKRYAGKRLDARMMRVLVKIVTILGFNPFARYYPLEQGEGWDHLIALGKSA